MKPEYLNGELTWDGCVLSELADAYGTPLHVISAGAIERSVKEFLQPFQEQKLPVSCYYSVKTNPVPCLLRKLASLGVGASVISEYELWLARAVGFSRVIVNGPAKSDELRLSAARAGVGMYSLDSEGEVDRTMSVAHDEDHRLKVGVRVCPCLGTLSTKTSSGAKNSPYGLAPAESLVAAERVHNHPGLKFVGFHMHIGTGIKDLKPYRKALGVMERTILKANERGVPCAVLNLGGGIGIASAPILNLAQIAISMLKTGSVSSPLKPDRLLDGLSAEVSRFAARLARRGCEIEELMLEPGRRISGSTQLTLLTVLDVIKKHNGARYVICDGGGMSLSPLLLVENHVILPVAEKKGLRQDRAKYSIIGNLPSILDRISSGVVLPGVQTGDRLALLDTGAYNVGFNNNFAGPRPGIAMIQGGRHELSRRAESFSDVISKDIKTEGRELSHP
jgi:diaminopimelate decarboxylase